MFEIIERTVRGKRVLKTFTTFAEACEYAKAMKPIHFEEDADYPGEAADFFAHGIVYAIERKGA